MSKVRRAVFYLHIARISTYMYDASTLGILVARTPLLANNRANLLFLLQL